MIIKKAELQEQLRPLRADADSQKNVADLSSEVEKKNLSC
jgi:hypothetical protein